MTPPICTAGRLYLRVGAGVYPVYGDDLRGWSLCPSDFTSMRERPAFAYASLDELFFALVNLCAPGLEERRRQRHAASTVHASAVR